MTTTDTPAITAPTAYDLAMLLISALPRYRVHDGHFTSVGTTLRGVENGVEIDCDVTLNFFDAGLKPVRFVLRVSEPELVPVEAGVEVGVPA